MGSNISEVLNSYDNNYVIVARQGNSYSSEVYTVKSKSGIYILKMPYDNKAFFTETVMLDFLNSLFFNCPVIVDRSFGSKSFIMTRLEGENGGVVLLRKYHVYQIIKIITSLHCVSVPNGIDYYDYDIIIKTFRSSLEKIGEYLGGDLTTFLWEYCNQNFCIIENRSYTSLIHRDIRLGNIIFSGLNDVNLIDFESCAMGDPVMDLMKIYPELNAAGSFLGELLLQEYSKQTGVSRSDLGKIVAFYIILDKINSLAWCYDRNRIGCDYYKSCFSYLLNIYQKEGKDNG